MLNEKAYLGDWLIEEFGAPNFCREEVTVLAPVDIPTGTVIGTATTLTTDYVPYDNTGGANTGKAAAAAGILVSSITANPAQTCSIVNASTTGTGTTTTNHGLAVGDIISVTGGSDADLNAYAAVASVPTSKTFTIATSSVSDATYAVSIQKLNQAAVAMLRGPAVVANLDWGTSDSTGVTAGTAELKALSIIIREGV